MTFRPTLSLQPHSRGGVCTGIAVTIIAALVGGAIASSLIPPAFLLWTVIATSLLSTALWHVSRPQRSYFEPIYLAIFILFGMYVTRPLALLVHPGPHYFKNYRVDNHIMESLALVIVGVLALLLGYHTRNSRRNSTSSDLESVWLPERVIVLAAFLSVFAMGLFSVYVRQMGGLGNILAGRSAARSDVFDRSSAYFWAAPQMLFPCSLAVFLLFLSTRQRRYLPLAFGILLPLLVIYVSTGSRAGLLPIALGFAASYYLFKGRNPPAILAAVAVYLAITVGLNFFVQIRNSGAAARADWMLTLRSTLTSPATQAANVFWDGQSNDMFESLAIQLNVVPNSIPYQPISFIYGTFAKVVPRVLWAGKPLAPEENLARIMFPYEIATTRASSTPGMIGYGHLFGGALGIFLFMWLIGFSIRWTWDNYLARPKDIYAIGLLALSLGFVAIALRGAPGETLARMLFNFGPFLLIAKFSKAPLSPSFAPTRNSRQA